MSGAFSTSFLDLRTVGSDIREFDVTRVQLFCRIVLTCPLLREND